MIYRLSLLLLHSTVIICFFSLIASGQQNSQSALRIAYHLAMPKPVTHLFDVQIKVGDLNQESVEFQMPKWSPGRYAIFDFAKNVQEVRAMKGNCPVGTHCKDTAPLTVRRVDDQTWRVPTNGVQTLTLSYKVYGDDLSGTHSQLDNRHANFNGSSIFMYIVGHKQDPVKLSIDAPNGWRIINGYSKELNQREWQFPNYDILIDTPTEIAPDWTIDEFRVDGKLYRVVVHSFGDEGGKRAALVKDIEKIVKAQTSMWGAPDFDSYTFIIHFAADDRSEDGMEHLTSTQIIKPGALADPGIYEETLGTVSHEFFHVWNIKRLRPVELGPWDFTRPVNTRALWIAEGITNYYGHLMQRRAGIWSDEEFFSVLASIISQVESLPGNRLMSAEESSLVAAFLDDTPHAQRTNLHNTSISYYWKGELVGLMLDMLIRNRTHGEFSLDDVMKRMYEEFYLKSPNATYYLRGRGYTSEDFERVASAVAGTDLSDFFKRYVSGIEPLPYQEMLAYLGLQLIKSPLPEPYSAGIIFEQNDIQSMRISNIVGGSAAENAGLKQGDLLLSIGNSPVTRANWVSTLNRYKQGDHIPISVRRDRKVIQGSLSLGAPDLYDYRIEIGSENSLMTKTFRSAWLNGKMQEQSATTAQ
jgi:predicted metalloprotease with PDZ domain